MDVVISYRSEREDMSTRTKSNVSEDEEGKGGRISGIWD